MAAPNIVGVTTITGKTDVLDVVTTESAITTNAASSGQVYKINSLIVSNVNNDSDVTVSLSRNSANYQIVSSVPIPSESTLVVISKDTALYLEEGDSINLESFSDGDLQAICTYEIIS